ncbi:MAG TPA: AAA family ATPase [Dehalococcoidia bacterium]
MPPPEPAPTNYAPIHLAERILKERRQLEGERRNVTVLFIDAADSTATGSRVDPEVLHSVVRDCTQLMVDAVHRHEGTITQFRGDGIMALFGAPIALEDSARRAVSAALAMRDSLTKFAAELEAAGKPHFRYRIGLNSGPVIVGRIADDLSMDYTAIGDTVNMAARMEQLARSDAIYITADTHRQVRQYFEFRPLGPIEVKGKGEAVEVYEVLRDLKVRDRFDAARAMQGLSPFVGREQELSALAGYFGQTSRGRGQVVFVSGEAGMGKSRLLLEFRETLDAEAVTWLEGHCSVYGESTAYMPVAEMVRRAFGVQDGDTEDEILARIDTETAGWEPAARQTVDYLRFLLSVSNAVSAMEPSERRAGILDGLRALILQTAKPGKPLVLMIEDLHWVDQQSQEAIAALIDVIASAPVLLLLDFRPGYEPPFGSRSYFSHLSLGSLNLEDSLRISTAILEGAALPMEISALIAQKAEGNPFYVEEVTKALMESGAMRLRDGALVLTKPVQQIEIPDTIQGVILSRIDRLEQRERELIQLASVIGREFTVRLLERIADARAELTGILDELNELELIYEKGRFPELAYMFNHALTHDVAYSTLLMERRRYLHRTVAQAIEELYGERLAEHYEMLAYHFYEGQDWDKARSYLMLAASKALDAYANNEAIAFVEKAFQTLSQDGSDSTGDSDARTSLRLLRGRALTQAGKWAPARQDLEPALAETTSLTIDQRLTGLLNLALASWWSRDTPAVRRAANELRDVATEAGRPELANVADAWLASAYSADGDPLTSLEHMSSVLSQAERLGVRMTSGPLSHFSLWNYWTGRLDTALESGRELAQKARHENQVVILMEALPHLGVALAAKGLYAEAAQTFAEARQAGERYNVQAPLARCIAMEAGFHLDVLDFETAEELALEARRRAQAASFPPAYVSAGIDLLLNYARSGNIEPSAALEAEVGEAVEREAGWHGWLWKLRFADARAELSVARGEWQTALGFAQEAIERGVATGRVKYQVAALSAEGRALTALGRGPEALDAFRRAVDLARSIGDPAMFLRAANALLAFEQSVELAAESRQTAERIAAALPSEDMRSRFNVAVAGNGG